MSAATVWTALEQKLKTIPGINTVMLGEPTAVHNAPLLYAAYQEMERFLHNHPPARNQTGDNHTFALRLILEHVDFQESERTVLNFIESIPNALDASPQLDATITAGFATISRAITAFVTIGGTEYRAVEFTCQVIEKRLIP